MHVAGNKTAISCKSIRIVTLREETFELANLSMRLAAQILGFNTNTDVMATIIASVCHVCKAKSLRHKTKFVVRLCCVTCWRVIRSEIIFGFIYKNISNWAI